MFLHSVNPSGAYTSIDLVGIPIWRLELSQAVPHAAKRGSEGQAPPPTAIAVVLTYVASGTKSKAVIASVDVRSEHDAAAIAEIGLPAPDHGANKARLTEAAKVLYNLDPTVMAKAVVEETIPKVSRLADVYEAIYHALAGGGALGGALDMVGPVVKGSLDGWKYAVTRSRFDPWRNSSETVGGGQAQAVSLDGGFAPPAPGNQAPTGGLGGKPPPPDAEPPGKKTQRPSREALRKTGGMGAPPAPGTPPPSDVPSEPVAGADDVTQPATSGDTTDV